VGRPTTQIHEAVWPLDLIEIKPAVESDAHIAAVRWRDAGGQEGQSSIGEIVHQVRDGKVVTVGGVVTEVIERDGYDLLVVDGSSEPLLALPRW
jgi:hypothetical protein